MTSNAGARCILLVAIQTCGKGSMGWRDGTAAISPGAISKRSVSVLWETAGPDQGTVLGRRRVCAGVQAAEERELPMASKRERGEGDHSAAAPLVHGGAERGTAEGESADGGTKAGTNAGKVLKILAFCSVLWQNRIMKTSEKTR